MAPPRRLVDAVFICTLSQLAPTRRGDRLGRLKVLFLFQEENQGSGLFAMVQQQMPGLLGKGLEILD